MTKERLALLETEKMYDGNKNAVAQELADFLVADSHVHDALHQRASNLLAKISPDFAKHGMTALLSNQQALAHNVANSSFDLYDSSVYAG